MRIGRMLASCHTYPTITYLINPLVATPLQCVLSIQCVGVATLLSWSNEEKREDIAAATLKFFSSVYRTIVPRV